MDEISIIFAKLAALDTVIINILNARGHYFDPSKVMIYFKQFQELHKQLIEKLPQLYLDFPVRDLPTPQGDEYEGRGYIFRDAFEDIRFDLSYIFQVRAHSGIAENSTVTTMQKPKRIFISHGRSPDWYKVQRFIENDLQIATLELAQEVNQGRTILQKLSEESEKCSYAVIIMTGDDEVTEGQPRARENVMHEIGFFQGRFGLKMCACFMKKAQASQATFMALLIFHFPKIIFMQPLLQCQRKLILL